MEINGTQSRGNWSVKWQRRYKRLLGNHTWSKRDQADENEVNDVSTRRRKLTEKGRAYRATLLKERREKINGRMARKCNIIVDFLFSNKNRIAVEEELAQFNDLFKMLLNIHEVERVSYSQIVKYLLKSL